MFESLLYLVDQDQDRSPGRQLGKGGIDRQKLAMDFLDFGRSRGVEQALLQQGQHFTIGASALALSGRERRDRRAARISVWPRISSSRRSPAPLMTTERRLSGGSNT